MHRHRGLFAWSVVLWAALALFAGWFHPAVGAAAPAAAVYGMAQIGEGIGLVRLDAASGVTAVVAVVGGSGVVYERSALDPTRRRYYYAGSDGVDPSAVRLRVFDLAAGTVADGPVLANFAPGGLEVDPADGALYALTSGRGPLVRVDPVTGAVSIVAEVPGGYVVPRDATAFDPWRRRYLGVAYTGEYPAVIRRLLAVDTRTGAVALGPALDQEVFGVEYDPGAGALYGLQNTGYYGTGFRLLRLDTATGASTVVATVSGYSVTPMVTAYDPEGHRYTAIGDTGEYPNVTHRLFTFDTQRGAVTAGPALDRQPVNVRTDAPVPVPRLFMPFVPKAAA